MADLAMSMVFNSVNDTRQGVNHKITYSVQTLNLLKPKQCRLSSVPTSKRNMKASNLGFQQVDVCLLRIFSGVAVNSGKGFYQFREKRRFRDRPKFQRKRYREGLSQGQRSFVKNGPSRTKVSLSKDGSDMAIQKHVKISSLEGGGDNHLYKKKKNNNNNHNTNNNNTNKNKLNSTEDVDNVNRSDVTTNFDTNKNIDKKNKKNIKHKKAREKLSSLTWATSNVRTLGFHAVQSIDKRVQNQHFDKFPLAVLEATNRNLELVCLQEVRYPEHGSFSKDGYTLHYSGLPIGYKRSHGVGILLTDELARGIAITKYISPRIMWIAGKFKGVDMAFFSAYAPTNMYSLEDKEMFYEQLEDQVKVVPRQYRKYMLFGADFNARIGSKVPGLHDCTRGNFIFGQSNENGELLLNFCERNGLFIANSTFDAKMYGTWSHPRSSKWHTLDYQLVPYNHRGDVTNCAVDMNVDFMSDRNVVKMKIILNGVEKIRSTNVKKAIKKDYGRLQTDMDLRKLVGVELDNRLKEVSISTPADIIKVNSIISKVCNSLVPTLPKKRKNADWFDISRKDIEKLLSERREARAKCRLGSVTDADKTESKRLKALTQRKLRNMQNDFWDGVSSNVQLLEKKGDSKGYFKSLKIVYAHNKGNVPQVLEKLDGSLTTTPAENMARWVEHFTALLNQKGAVHPDIEKYLPDQCQIEWSLDEPFTVQEIVEAANMMGNDKAPGQYDVPIEPYNYSESDEIMVCITAMFNVCLETGVVVSEWKDVIIAVLFKKGRVVDCNNYRGLSLIAHIGKLLEKVLQFRGTELSEKRAIPESQFGFRANCSTVDAMFVSALVSSSAREKGIPLYKVYFDLTKAYDKVIRLILWMIMRRRGYPPKYIAVIISLHVGAMASVRIDGVFSDPFELECGLKQGSVVAPMLFNIYSGAFTEAFHKRLTNEGVPIVYRVGGEVLNLQQLKAKSKVSNKTLTEFLYADDCQAMAIGHQNIQKMTDIYVDVSVVFGQDVAIKKTEAMAVQPRGGVQVPPPVILIHGTAIKAVKEFKYVGRKENDEANMTSEVPVRCVNMCSAYNWGKDRLFQRREIRLRTKWAAFRAIVMTNITYGAPSWNITVAQIAKLESQMFRLLRDMMGYKAMQKKSYLFLIERLSRAGIIFEPVCVIIARAMLSYVGHIER
jgi:hypothetical protein